MFCLCGVFCFTVSLIEFLPVDLGFYIVLPILVGFVGFILLLNLCVCGLLLLWTAFVYSHLDLFVLVELMCLLFWC